MSMNMPNGAGYARMTSALSSINQGGGSKKAGLVSTVGRPGSSYGALRKTTGGCTVFGMSRPINPTVKQSWPIGMHFTRGPAIL